MATHAEIERRGALAERQRVIAHVKARADRLERGKPSDDRKLLARRLRVLAGDLGQGLHEGEGDHA